MNAIMQGDPEAAPLSATLDSYLFEHYYWQQVEQLKRMRHPVPRTEEEASHQYTFIRRSFLQRISEKRQEVFRFMDPLVRADQDVSVGKRTISPEWFRKMLGSYTPSGAPITKMTLSRYYDYGLVRREAGKERGNLEVHSVAELLITVGMQPDKKEQGWFPLDEYRALQKISPPGEGSKWWWCWLQLSPEEPIVVCPYPLPANLPKTALVLGRWAGTVWDGWTLIDPLIGSARFAGALDLRKAEDVDALSAWSPDARLVRSGLVDRSTLLEDTLRQLASERFARLSVN